MDLMSSVINENEGMSKSSRKTSGLACVNSTLLDDESAVRSSGGGLPHGGREVEVKHVWQASVGRLEACLPILFPEADLERLRKRNRLLTKFVGIAAGHRRIHPDDRHEWRGAVPFGAVVGLAARLNG